MTEPFLQEIRGTLETITFYMKGMEVTAIEKLVLEKGKLKSGHPQAELYFYHLAGQEYKDAYVIETSKRVLSSLVPDLEERLPWYGAMYTILNKGEWKREGSSSTYHLNPEDKERIITSLQERDMFFAQLPSDLQRFYVTALAIDLAAAPGKRLGAIDLTTQETPQRVLTIWHCLHLPWGMVDGSTETVSSAELVYAKVRRRFDK